MYNKSVLDGFELIEVRKTYPTKGLVTIDKSKRVLSISKRFMDLLPWGDLERVNLLKKGETFALVPHKVGLVKVHKYKSKGGYITSSDLCLKVLANSRGCRTFEGWVEEDTLFFKPQKGDE